eukprot:TRINITY_DN5022_c0_g1_i1.p3 TRINITY_DN5022_c0_g1~~TRINITY_DN5022_c0_g1_i1.p3  ORF type:complete len:161 (+),score=45.49 TRINITY_DN5022_c0_g1_i1:34-516(+)
MIRRPPRSTQSRSSAASDVYKRQPHIQTKNAINLPGFVLGKMSPQPTVVIVTTVFHKALVYESNVKPGSSTDQVRGISAILSPQANIGNVIKKLTPISVRGRSWNEHLTINKKSSSAPYIQQTLWADVLKKFVLISRTLATTYRRRSIKKQNKSLSECVQ